MQPAITDEQILALIPRCQAADQAAIEAVYQLYGDRLYRYLLARAGNHLNGGQPFAPESIQMIYWYTDFPSEPSTFHYDASLFKRDEAAIEKLVSEIESLEKFELTNDEGKCRFCAYRSYCNRGVTAGDWHDAEAEAEVHEAFDINFEQIGEIAF